MIYYGSEEIADKLRGTVISYPMTFFIAVIILIILVLIFIYLWWRKGQKKEGATVDFSSCVEGHGCEKKDDWKSLPTDVEKQVERLVGQPKQLAYNPYETIGQNYKQKGAVFSEEDLAAQL